MKIWCEISKSKLYINACIYTCISQLHLQQINSFFLYSYLSLSQLEQFSCIIGQEQCFRLEGKKLWSQICMELWLVKFKNSSNELFLVDSHIHTHSSSYPVTSIPVIATLSYCLKSGRHAWEHSCGCIIIIIDSYGCKHLVTLTVHLRKQQGTVSYIPLLATFLYSQSCNYLQQVSIFIRKRASFHALQ